jgi:hypothetical protein
MPKPKRNADSGPASAAANRSDDQSAALPPDILDSVSAVLATTVIQSPSRFQIGTRPPIDGAALAAPGIGTAGMPGNPAPWAASLVAALWPHLYDAAYARPFLAEPAAPIAPPTEGLSERDLLAQLVSAFPEATRWDPFWRVYRAEPTGAVHVQKGDRCRFVQPGTFMFTGFHRGPVQTGSVVSVQLSAATSAAQPGFYHLSGAVPGSDHDEAMLARFYLNTLAESVVPLLQQIAATFNAFVVPFQIKTLTDPASYDRSDSTVLYVARRFVPIVLKLLDDILPAYRVALADPVPLFTKRLAPGLGAADDPGSGVSFGQSRSLLLAEAIVDAWCVGSQDVSARLRALANRFAFGGLRIDQPHLSSGNFDIYTMPTAPETKSWS